MIRKFRGVYVLAAFTLVEMLVVIAVIAIAAALLFPAFGSSKEKAQQTACRGNLRQLGLAFQLYQGDFDDQFPAPGSAYEYGPQPEDWIWWQYGRGVAQSTIGKYVGSFQPAVFTCPADRRAQSLQSQGYLPNEPYRYSYALTSYSLTNGLNPGMATIVTQERMVYPFRARTIKNPAVKMMLVEEDELTIDDPRWVPFGDRANLVSARHRGKGDSTFADGHVETVSPQFGTNLINSNPLY